MNLFKSLSAISGMTLVSRIFGFIRDLVLARVFGAGAAMDAFTVAFRLPNLLRRLFAEGAFSQSFIPVLTGYRAKKTEEETRLFLARISGTLSLILLIVTAVGILSAPWILWLSAPGFNGNPSKMLLTVELLRITFPYILFISLSSLVSSVLNTWNQFSIPAFAPTLLNITFIIFALFVSPYCHPPILALSFAVSIGGALQLLFQLPALKKIGLLVIPCFDLRDLAVWGVFKKMGPAIFGVSIAQLSLVINTIFASFLVSGSVSWIYYADRLMELPVGLLAASIGTVLLPLLSEYAIKRQSAAFSALLDWAIRLLLILALPASVGLALLSLPLIQTLFMYGKFSAFDANMTQQALLAYSVGLVGMILVKVFALSFYALQDLKTPVKVGVWTLALTQLMNVMFIPYFAHAGLSLSIALGALFNASTLLVLLCRRGFYCPKIGWCLFFIKTLFALGAMSITLLLLQHFLPCQFDGLFSVRAFWILLLIGSAILVYFSSLFLLGVRLSNWTDVSKKIHR